MMNQKRLYSTFGKPEERPCDPEAHGMAGESHSLLNEDEIVDDPKAQEKVTYRMMYSFTALMVLSMLAIYWAVSHQYSASYTTQSTGSISSLKKSHHKGKTTAKKTISNKRLIDKPQKTGAASADHPNVVFFLIDDLGHDSIGYDATELADVVPYMTALYKTGVTFEKYYSQEVCTPARASLLTGRMPISLGMQYGLVSEMVEWGLNTSEVTFAEVLKDYGEYTNVAIGKWHLGHWQPQYLPTARGFDEYLGYVSGEDYYWSKKCPVYSQYTDLIYSDSDCYFKYNLTDLSDYSTFMFGDKAVSVVSSHDFDSSPLFLYLPFQAAHDPYHDIDPIHDEGVPPSYVGQAVYQKFASRFTGSKRLQHILSLYLFDQFVNDLIEEFKSVGQYENTYFFFASDNGGCYKGGGRNGGLRGCKGTLFEGGTNVDAFIHSPLLPSSVQGSRYYGLTHVSDMFPTMLDFLGIDYTPTSSANSLDGYSHYDAILGNDDSPRSVMLYNMWFKYNSDDIDYDWANSSFAIRNERYKLLHVHQYNTVSEWYDEDEVLNDDDDYSLQKCDQAEAIDGNMTYFLFDLDNDPYETSNLYTTDETSKYYTIIVSFFSYLLLNFFSII
jgi:arylsulfatase A-like enzyme